MNNQHQLQKYHFQKLFILKNINKVKFEQHNLSFPSKTNLNNLT